MIAPSRRDSVEFRIVPVPRQEFIEFAHRLISNAGENVGKPSLRIDVVELAVWISVYMSAPALRAGEEP